MGGPRRLKEPKPKAPMCNCPAASELYGKAFPHRAGNVKGCHMGADGAARDGWARPGCLCRACDSTNVAMSFGGYGTNEGHVETYSNGNPDIDPRNWERDIAQYEEIQAGITP